MSHLISCRTSVYGQPEEAFQLMPEAGITCAELCGPNADTLADVQACGRRYGVEIGTIGTGVDLGKDESVTGYLTLVRAAAGLGIDKVFTSVSATGDESEVNKIAKLRALSVQAADRGVVICMETHPPFAENGSKAAAIMDAVALPSLRMNFDTANVFYYNENIDGVAELRKVVDRVETLHLKETDGAYHSMDFPVLGAGVVEFSEIFAICDEAGVPGPFTLELEGPLTSGKSLDERQTAVKACMAYLRSIGAVE